MLSFYSHNVIRTANVLPVGILKFRNDCFGMPDTNVVRLISWTCMAFVFYAHATQDGAFFFTVRNQRHAWMISWIYISSYFDAAWFSASFWYARESSFRSGAHTSSKMIFVRVAAPASIMVFAVIVFPVSITQTLRVCSERRCNSKTCVYFILIFIVRVLIASFMKR